MTGMVKRVGVWFGLHIPLARFRRRVALALFSTSARYLNHLRIQHVQQEDVPVVEQVSEMSTWNMMDHK